LNGTGFGVRDKKHGRARAQPLKKKREKRSIQKERGGKRERRERERESERERAREKEREEGRESLSRTHQKEPRIKYRDSEKKRITRETD